MKKAYLLSLGCAKNRVDSERFLGILRGAGYEAAEEPQGTDLCVVNTCGFLQSAVRENLDALLELELMKERGLVGRIAVLGCLVNRYEEELKAELPSVDSLDAPRTGAVSPGSSEARRPSIDAPSRGIGSCGISRWRRGATTVVPTA